MSRGSIVLIFILLTGGVAGYFALTTGKIPADALTVTGIIFAAWFILSAAITGSKDDHK